MINALRYIKIMMEPKSKFRRLLGESPLVKVLDFFLENDVYDYSKSEVAQETGVSRVTLQEIFARLEKLDVIKKTRVSGKAQLYQFNKQNPTVQSLIEFDLMIRGLRKPEISKKVAVEA